MDCKFCPRCEEALPVSEFYKKSGKPGQFHAYCKQCTKNYELGRRCEDNREQRNETSRRWLTRQRETNAQYKLAISLRVRLIRAIQRNWLTGSTVEDLGCSIDFLKAMLECQFDENMTWDNWGTYWHIDHIRPLASFDLTDREQFLEAAHWSNLQPLEKIANLKKGARLAA